MASGLPVLAFDHAAAGQLIEHGESGWLAPYGDSVAFVRLAQALAHDPAAARRAGQAARRSALGAGLGRHRAPDRDGLRVGADRAPQPGAGRVAAGTLGRDLNAAPPAYSRARSLSSRVLRYSRGTIESISMYSSFAW